MAKALGIVTSGNRIKVEGMQAFRPVSAFTFIVPNVILWYGDDMAAFCITEPSS